MRRILHIFLCICICFSVCVSAVSAEDNAVQISENAEKKPVIILKFDDLGAFNVSGFDRVADECEALGVRCCFGVVVDRTVSGKPSGYQNNENGVFVKMREWYTKGIEIWNHGLHHTKEEYSANTYEQQLADFGEAQKFIKDTTGITMTAFGSPFNNSTEITQKMIAENFPEIKAVMFEADENGVNPGAVYIPDAVNFEKATGVVTDFEAFVEDYRKKEDKDCLILQGHPGDWSDSSYERFRKIVEFLKSEGVSFAVPTEYAGYSLPELEEPVLTFEDKIEVRINKTELEFDVQPQIINDRTMVPFRTIFETLGAEVSWDENLSAATGVKGDVEIKITNNSKTAYINGRETVTDTAPVIVDGRFLVPVRFISETFGCYVYWDAAETTVFIVPNLTKQEITEDTIEIKDAAFNDFQYIADELGVFSYDGNESTVWSAEGKNRWICYDLGEKQNIGRISVMWNKGDVRKTYYKVYISDDSENFSLVYDGESSGTNAGYEDVALSGAVSARYVKIECNGNSAETSSKWNAIKEIVFYK